MKQATHMELLAISVIILYVFADSIDPVGNNYSYLLLFIKKITHLPWELGDGNTKHNSIYIMRKCYFLLLI